MNIALALLAVAVEFGLEFSERVRLQAAPGIRTPPVINALIKIAAFTDRTEAALLLLVNQLHIDRIVPRNNLAQGSLVEIADLQRGIDITARTAVHDPGRQDLHRGQEQRAGAVLVNIRSIPYSHLQT